MAASIASLIENYISGFDDSASKSVANGSGFPLYNHIRYVKLNRLINFDTDS